MSNSLSDYEVFDAIGKGGFGTVRLARHIKSFRRVAIKIVDKDEMVNAGHTMQLRLEIRFLKLLNHPNIVKLLDVIETPMRISMVMEFGGIHLKEYVLANVKVMEHEAREIFRSIVKALNYLHAHCIVHRDVKPQNILIDTNRNVKLIDFGLASYFVHNSFLAAACGSLQYCAPELLERKNYCGPEVDTWSLGVVLYFMLCGRLPFDDANRGRLQEKIIEGSYKTPELLSSDAVHLLSRLMDTNMSTRSTLEEVGQHRWTNGDGFFLPIKTISIHRRHLKASSLDFGIVSRLIAFGFEQSEITNAFNSSNSDGHPICATYILLKDLIDREKGKKVLVGIRNTDDQNTVTQIEVFDADWTPKFECGQMYERGPNLDIVSSTATLCE